MLRYLLDDCHSSDIAAYAYLKPGESSGPAEQKWRLLQLATSDFIMPMIDLAQSPERLRSAF